MDSNESSEKCREVFALLSDYLNLELPTDACEVIEAHLHGCPPCVEFAESLRKTVELCRQYRPSEFPSSVGERAREDLLQTYKTYKKTLADRR
jgi:hypothetical protein